MSLWDEWMGDVRHAGRRLRRERTFTVMVSATLAIGIGATTALFSVLDTALLRPLPFRAASELVYVWGTWGPEREVRGASFPETEDWREGTRSFVEWSIWYDTPLALAQEAGARQIEAEVVSPGYLEMLGAEIVLGRALQSGDAVPNAEPVLVIGYGLWQTAFGGDAEVVGRRVRVDGRPFTVVGVTGAGFLGLTFEAEAWTTLAAVSPSMLSPRGARWLAVVARLGPGASLEGAQVDVDRVTAQLEQQYPAAHAERGAQLVTLRDEYVATTRSLILILFGAVLFLLLISCVNVTNLQVVRGLAREPELSLRNALGAGRTRLVRQLLVEGMLVALIGALLGAGLAYWGLDALLAVLPEGALPPFVEAGMNGRAVLFAILVGIVAGALATLAPALRATRRGLARNLLTGTRVSVRIAGTPERRVSLQQVLVTAECALAVMVLIGAGLLVRSFRELTRIHTGFDVDGVTVARIDLPTSIYDGPARTRFVNALMERIAENPAVTNVAVTTDAPLRGRSTAEILQRVGNEQERIRYHSHSVTAGYFEMLDIALLAGRTFTVLDRPDNEPIAIASRALARRLWPGEDAVNQRVRLGGPEGSLVTIVGVVDDVRQRELRARAGPGEDPDLYFLFAQRPADSFEILVRARSRPADVFSALRNELAVQDPSLPLYAEGTLAGAVREQTATDRFGSLVLAIFATLSLLLAAVGIYAIMAFFVGQRRREMAIRLAFGASPRSIRTLVLRQGAMILGIGALLGTIAAAIATRTLGALLYNVRPVDPASFTVALGVLLAVGLVAVSVPAQRALRVAPALSLGADE